MTEPETDFYINNRGISAKSLSFNSIESEVTIDIGNQEDEKMISIVMGFSMAVNTAIIQNRDKIPVILKICPYGSHYKCCKYNKTVGCKKYICSGFRHCIV